MAEACPPTASNFVCTANIRGNLNINVLAHLFGGRASRDAFPCCTITGINPRVTFQIFKGGKIVISGASSEAEGHWGLVQLVSRLSAVTRTHIKLRDFRKENIVAFGGVPFHFDQLTFFRDHQVATGPPQRFLDLAKNPATTTEQQQPKQPPKGARGKKRKQLQGTTFSQFKSGRFRGLQYFPCYPLVIIWYDTGKYVVTGTNDPDEILRVVNCIDWSQYTLPNEIPLEEYRAKLAALHRAKAKRTAAGGLKCFDNTKLFSGVVWEGFTHIQRQLASKSKHHHA